MMNPHSRRWHHAIHQAGKKLESRDGFEIMKGRSGRVQVQEGDAPAEDPDEILHELDQTLTQLESIIRKINLTNANTPFADGMRLSDALSKRDLLGKRRDILNEAVNLASIKQDRYSKSEVKFYSTINVSQIQQEIDRLSNAYRELDTRIQELNWKTDVME